MAPEFLCDKTACEENGVDVVVFKCFQNSVDVVGDVCKIEIGVVCCSPRAAENDIAHTNAKFFHEFLLFRL